MSILTAIAPPVNSTPDSRQVPYAGHWITGAELARVRSAQNRVYYSRVGSPYSDALDDAMDRAALAELDRILAEQDAEFDAMAEASAQLDRLESGYCL